MIRLFVALAIPESVRRQMALLSGGVPGARWMTGEQLHLTLRFIGDVDQRVASDVDDALQRVTGPVFRLEFAGVGEFGSKVPRALWAGVRDAAPVVALHRKIEAALQHVGLEAEERKFTPHVTVARLKSAPSVKVREFLSAHALFAADPFTVDHFVLYSSQLSHNGSIYSPERSYALAA